MLVDGLLHYYSLDFFLVFIPESLRNYSQSQKTFASKSITLSLHTLQSRDRDNLHPSSPCEHIMVYVPYISGTSCSARALTILKNQIATIARKDLTKFDQEYVEPHKIGSGASRIIAVGN